MHTDPSIYTFLATDPEACRVLTGGLTLPGAYIFRSITLKSLERRLDALYEPDGHTGPVYAIEFQARAIEGAWYNPLTKIGLYGEEYPSQEVRGLLIFLRERDDPWRQRPVARPDALVSAIYLDQFLPAWLEREPTNPLAAALAPLILTRDADLQARAPVLWQTIQTAPLAAPVREALSQMLECWLFERFQSLTAREIWTMLNVFTPLEQTRAYRSIFIEGKAEDIKRLLNRRFGALPEWATARIDAANLKQLDTWLDQIFDAETLESLLGPPRRSRTASGQRKR